jgi:hypothetical protein
MADDVSAHPATDREAVLPYSYTPLPTPTSIRLLQVLPAPVGQIKCAIKVVDLEDDMDFNALSYTWGNPVTVYEKTVGEFIDELKNHSAAAPRDDGVTSLVPRDDNPEGVRIADGDFIEYLNKESLVPYQNICWATAATCQIECDGQALQVTQNLYDILDYLRFISLNTTYATTTEMYSAYEALLRKPVWIDAICINQNDLAEREAQVMLMSRIYRSAAIVIAWLGPKDRLARRSLQAVKAVFEFHAQTGSPLAYTLKQVPGVEQGAWFALFALLQRLWFRRAWVAQEAVFAKDLVLHASSDGRSLSIPWRMYAQVIDYLHSSGLAQQLSAFGQSLLTRQPLQPDLRRVYCDDLALEVLGSMRGSGATSVGLLARPQDAYSFVLGVEDIRERLGFTGANLRLVFDDEEQQNLRRGEITSAEFPGTIDSFEGTLRAESLFDGGHEEKKDLTEKDKMLNVVRQKARSEKSRIVCTIVTDAGKGVILDVHRPLSLIKALSAFRGCTSTDPRDKVFAFLNFASQDLGVRPDYAKSPLDVFQTTAEAILMASNSLELLSHVQDPTATVTDSLPSWVPDFASPLGRVALTDGVSAIFNASGQEGDILIDISPDHQLTVWGLRIDEVVEAVALTDADDMALSAMRLTLAIPTAYTRVGRGVVPRLSPMNAFPDSAVQAILSELQTIYPEGTMYVAIGKSLVEIPHEKTSVPVFNVEPPEEERSLVQPGPTAVMSTPEVLWRTLIADGWLNEGTAPHAWQAAFSDWLLCSILNSYRTITVTANLLTPSNGVLSEDKRRALKHLFDARVRRKLEAWLDLSVGIPISADFTDDYIKNLAGEDSPPLDSPLAWFQSFVELAAMVMEAFAQKLEMSFDEERGQVNENLPGAVELHLYRQQMDGQRLKKKENLEDNLSEDRGIPSMGQVENLLDAPRRQRVKDFETRMQEAIAGRKLLRTRGGLLGLGPKSTDVEKGDQIWVLRGATVPFVLRPADDGKYRLIGEAYVHGAMRGEALSMERAEFVRVTLQ